MAEEKILTRNGTSYIIIDCTLSEFADSIWKNTPTMNSERLTNKNARYVIYSVHEHNYFNMHDFQQRVRSKSMKRAIYAERKTEPEGRIERKVCYDKDTCEDVPENFKEQFVSAYMFDSENREHRQKIIEIIQSFTLGQLKSTVLIQDLQIQVETHCQTLGQLPVAELRKLMKRVVEASRLSPPSKTQFLKKLRTMNKTSLCRWLSHQGEIKIDEVPDRFLDPISMHIMLDPVVLPNGTTIDHRSYANIMEQPEPKNPYTREPLDPGNVPPPNLFAKEMISDFVRDYAIDIRGNS
jgi:hypothetical protein